MFVIRHHRLPAIATALVALAVSAPPAATADRVVTVAGTGLPGNTGDGGDARKARVAENLSLDMGSDGTLHVLDRDTGGLRAITPDGRIDRVPGTERLEAVDADAVGHAVYLVTSTELWRVTDGQATRLHGDLRNAASVAASATGVVYVAEHAPDGARIRRIAPDLTTTTVAGGSVALKAPRGLTLDARGLLCFVTADSAVRLQSDGTLRTLVADLGDPAPDVEGLSMGPDDRMYVLDVRSGVGGVRVVEPGDEESFAGPGAFAPEDIAAGPNGEVYLATRGRILRLRGDGTTQDRSAGADPWAEEAPGTVVPIAERLAEFRTGTRTLLKNTPRDMAVSADGTVHVVDADRLHTALGPASVIRGRGDSPSAIADLRVHNVAPADGGGLYVHATTAARQDLVLLVHPDKDEVQVLMGGPIPPSAAIERLEAAEGRLYFRDASGTLRTRDQDGSVHDIAAIGDAPFTVDRRGNAYYARKGKVFRVDGPGTDTRLRDIRDLAVAPDGTVYLATGTGIHAVEPGRSIDSVAPDRARLLVTDPHGNLYYATDDQVWVLVRPGQIAEFPWPFVAASAAALVLGGLGYLIARRGRL